MIAAGLTLAIAGFTGRYILQAFKHLEPQVKQAIQTLPKSAFAGYYKGGFEPKMTRREAALVLGVSVDPDLVLLQPNCKYNKDKRSSQTDYAAEPP
ncbi:mitochondrial import inner membrane translocase subunit TIM14-like isoform X2 [Lithobates pipiens]